MRRKGKSKSFIPSVDRNGSGNTYIGGTSTRPVIHFINDQPPTILADIPDGKDLQVVEEEIKNKEVDLSIEDDQDDRVYCTCKRLYDGRTMIACDRSVAFFNFLLNFFYRASGHLMT